MLRRFLVASVAFALTGFAVPVQAQTFTPPGSVIPSGSITTGPATCLISGSGTATSTTVALSATLSPGYFGCGTVLVSSGSWSIQRIPGSTSTVHLTLSIANIIANCSGTVVANWNNATSTVSFTNAIFGPNYPQCTYTGSIHVPSLQLL
jgi:hypothetical protein